MIHALKIKKKFFDAIDLGYKHFEVRLNDRDYKIGDFLALNEVDQDEDFTGRSILVFVDYILDDTDYCKDGYIIMSIKKCVVKDFEGRQFC